MNKHSQVKGLALTGVMTAVICVVGPLSIPIPFSPVPISMITLVLFLALYVLGTRRGCISYLIYLLIGLVGLPVFTAFTGGPGKLLGPTGGYLIGFVFMMPVSGLVIDRWYFRKSICFCGMLAGMLICYTFGTWWLSWQAQMSFQGALAAGVLPFIPGDLIKILLAMVGGPEIKKRLQKAGLND